MVMPNKVLKMQAGRTPLTRLCGSQTMKHYVALLEQDPESGTFVAIFPDLPGCNTQGDDYEDALAQATEALALYAEQYG